MTASSDEAKLVERAKEGNPAAFAEIYERHQAAVYRYVYFRTGDAATAEDLTGEVFVRVVEKVDGFSYRGHPLLSWLYTIARNVVIDYQRRAGRAEMVSLEERLVPGGGPDVEEAAERELAHRRLAAALSYLTEDQRQVIILKFVEQMSNEEVALALGKTVGAVKSLQHRALGALRRVLDRNEE